MVRDLDLAYGSFVLIQDLNFTIRRGDIFVIMGGSGCGKSTLMRQMIGLKPPAAGPGAATTARASGMPPPEEREQLMQRFGVLYQSGALWSSMTLAENVALPLGEYTDLGAAEIRELVVRSSSPWSALPGSRTTIRPRSAAACASAPAWRAPWRSIRRSCSSTSRRPGSTRSARAVSTT